MLPNVRKAIERLMTGDLYERFGACTTFYNAGPAAAPAVPAMVEALQTANDDLCRHLNRAFSEIGAPAVPALVEALRSENRTIRLRAAQALSFGPAAVDAAEALVALIDDPSHDIHATVTAALQHIRFGAVPVLLPLLKHEKQSIRSDAAFILRSSKAPSLIPALSKLLDDPDEGVRYQAKSGLDTIARHENIDEAIDAAVRALRSETSVWSLLSACDILADLGPAALPAVPVLIDTLNCRDASVRGGALVAFRYIGRAAVRLLVEALQFNDSDFRGRLETTGGMWSWTQDEVKFRCNVAMALQFIGREADDAVGALASWLKLPDRRLHQAASSALSAIGDAAVPGMLAIVQDRRKPATRERAIMVLGSIASMDAVPVLTELAENDGSGRVREQAAIALTNCYAKHAPTDAAE